MADYGHELMFGTFLTPAAAQADRVVALAQLTEQVGLDLVTVQDHPYQPAFLDTWTLLSVIAAKTQRVKVSPNVANLPLRPPYVLAKSVASLDILSGGRVELGLGAGAFREAIVAAGGPDRTVGENVEALEEGVRIIREVWSPERVGIKADGKHYQVVGAKRGPAPAHDVGIWLGAVKPRMLRLTGRLADGWMVSSPYFAPEKLAEPNAEIDAAALKAGRDPSDIRRIYNIGPGNSPLDGPVEEWVDRLTEITLTHGMSVYVFGSDAPDDIRRFAEVAEGVREAVEAARAGAQGTAPTGAGVTETATAAVAAPVVSDSGLGLAPTPDDGVRLSGERLWDESTRPTAPAPRPGQTYTATQRTNGQHLIDVHDHLRAELEKVRDLVEQVAAGVMDVGGARSVINELTMRQNNWTLGAYCESYCRGVTLHHTLEDDSIFPKLRRADPGLKPVLDRLEEEHHVIHDVLERVDRALVALVDGSGDVTQLRDNVNVLSDTLLSHLSYEERELVEPLSRFSLFTG
ncbi:LLM class flavin-dependent oxidoreductase [Streptomyces sp. NPDC096132]|uniref:LLM class flavin-dependent oxidoreductase n=1 Tax=Streptomyces sp. NPDC096132 TaxID=3366075 RepID=UPI0037FDE6D9